jgi:hypothetical protein
MSTCYVNIHPPRSLWGVESARDAQVLSILCFVTQISSLAFFCLFHRRHLPIRWAMCGVWFRLLIGTNGMDLHRAGAATADGQYYYLSLTMHAFTRLWCVLWSDSLRQHLGTSPLINRSKHNKPLLSASRIYVSFGFPHSRNQNQQ